jgi:hypothetical protein
MRENQRVPPDSLGIKKFVQKIRLLASTQPHIMRNGVETGVRPGIIPDPRNEKL